MNFEGFLPVRVRWTEEGPRVQWTEFGNQRLLAPFFEDDIGTQMREPFHQLFRRETSMDELLAWVESRPSLPLAGSVLHVSRCGSTLISQMLAAVPHHVVASEPAPLDQILRARFYLPDLPRETHLRWIRGMMAALAQPRVGGEDRFFLKPDCWHLNELDLLRDAFPDMPLLMLYREPLEVMVSHDRAAAAWAVPGMLHPSALRLEQGAWKPDAREVYSARALAGFYEGGLIAAQQHGAMLVNFNELPAAMFSRISRHFDLRLEDMPVMLEQSLRNAKTPGMPFVADSEEKRNSARDAVREATETYLRDVYLRLEEARNAQLVRGF
ncbi:sulfotransferase [Granulicella cerasi]|uniref:Sulfotransferase n=1 Tax=Granulicella cerasi TaxID=741063 RepID=A0ABW1ZBQ9_9BACT|nr:sulfotransferase [Granulicella cerasi]